MTTEQKEKYVKLLQKNGSLLANAILFYLINPNPELEKKKHFVEKVLDKYANIYSVSCGSYGEWVELTNIPKEIRVKLIAYSREDLLTEQKKNSKREELLKEVFIAEMNEIF